MTEISTAMMPYAIAVIGFLIVHVLKGIKEELSEVKTTVRAMEKDLRGGISEIDRRVSHLESRCEAYHK